MPINNLSQLKNKTALVVGAGGLGGYVIEHLARSLIGKIIVMDADSFSLSNMDRQLLSSRQTLGKNKALTAKSRISDISDTIVVAVPENFDKTNCHYINDADIVIDCVDNVDSRLLLERKCGEYGKILVHGAISGNMGQVAVIAPEKNVLKKLFSKTVTTPAKTISSYPAIVASIQAAEAIKYLTGTPFCQQLIIMDFSDMTFYKADLP